MHCRAHGQRAEAGPAPLAVAVAALLLTTAALVGGCGQEPYMSQVSPQAVDAGRPEAGARTDAAASDATAGERSLAESGPGLDASGADTAGWDAAAGDAAELPADGASSLDAAQLDAAGLDAAEEDASVFEPLPLPSGGEAYTVAVSATQTSRHYVQFGQDHLLRSNDHGSSWQSCAAPGVEVNGVIPAPEQADRVYLTTEADLLYSDDGCLSWASSGLGQPSHALVPLADGSLLVGTHHGLWRGNLQNWQARPSVLDDSTVRFLTADPSGQRLLAVGAGYGVAASSDGGATWVAANSGIEGVGIYSVALDAQAPEHALAAGFSGIFRSDDGGASWTRSRSGWNYYVAIDPSDGSRAIASTSNLLVTSNDGGSTWSGSDCRSAGMHHAFVNQLVFDPAAPGAVLAATSRGLFAAPDLGCGWAETDDGIDGWLINDIVTAPTLGDVYLATSAALLTSWDGWGNHSSGYLQYSRTFAVTLDVNDESRLFAGAAHQLHISTDRGLSFSQLTSSAGAWAYFAVRAQGDQIYAGNDEALRVSSDSGATWVTRQIAGVDRFVNDIAVLDWGGPSVLVATETGLFWTGDDGVSWSDESSGLDDLDVAVLVQVGDGSLLAGSATGVYSAVGLGAPWTALGPTPCDVRDLLLEADTLVVACDEGVRYSLDRGASWQPLPGLDDRWPMALGLDPSGQLLVGTNGYGLYRAALPQ